MNDQRVLRLAEWITRYPWWVVMGSLLLFLVTFSGARNLQFTTDYRVFFGQTNPQLIAFEALQQTYTKNDTILFVLAPKDGDVFSANNLSAVEWLTDQAWQIPYSIRVDSVSNFQHTSAEGDDILVEDLIIDANTMSLGQLAARKQIATTEPLLLDRLISPTGHVTGVNVTLQLPGKDPLKEVPEAVNRARDIKRQLQDTFPTIDVYITGMAPLNYAFEEAAKTDLKTLIPAMYLVILLLLGFLTRDFSSTFSTLALLTFSIFGAMGLAGWIGIKLTGPSATAPVIILTLGVADSVHFLSTMLQEIRAKGRNRADAIKESLRLNFQPSVTTAIGFLTLNMGEVPPLADMGNIVCFGVLLALIYSVTLLPAMMHLLPVRGGRSEIVGHRLIKKLGEVVVRRRRQLLPTMGVLIVALVCMIPRNELNDVFVHYFDDSFEVRRATDFLTENLSGTYYIHYSLGSGRSQGISDPKYLELVDQFANWYRAQPRVLHVNSITDTFKKLNQNLHGDDPSWYRLPDASELAAQYLLLYEMSLPYGLDLNNQINIDKSATKLTVTLETLSSNEMLALEVRAQGWLLKNGLDEMQVAGSSSAIMFSHIGYRNIRAMLVAAVIALVLISGLLIFALRSMRLGLISLVPNLAPAGVAFGLWGLFHGEVGLALSIIASVTLGIIVDDTIHFLSKYLRAVGERGCSPEQAVQYAFSSVGVALTFTTIVLAIGFMILALSPFQVNAQMGLMTAITVVLALVIDFLFLPPLLIALSPACDYGSPEVSK
jgi:predicted RND superfamily exporter protein